MCIPGEAHPHSWWVTSPIPSEDVTNHNGIYILTGNGDVTHRESKFSSEMCLNWNAHLHWESISSPGMQIVYTE